MHAPRLTQALTCGFHAAACTQKEVDSVFEAAKKAQKASKALLSACQKLVQQYGGTMQRLGLS